MAYCVGCGAPVDPAGSFCSSCGSPVQPAGQNAPASPDKKSLLIVFVSVAALALVAIVVSSVMPSAEERLVQRAADFTKLYVELIFGVADGSAIEAIAAYAPEGTLEWDRLAEIKEEHDERRADAVEAGDAVDIEWSQRWADGSLLLDAAVASDGESSDVVWTFRLTSAHYMSPGYVEIGVMEDGDMVAEDFAYFQMLREDGAWRAYGPYDSTFSNSGDWTDVFN